MPPMWDEAFSHLNNGSLICHLAFIGNDIEVLLQSSWQWCTDLLKHNTWHYYACHTEKHSKKHFEQKKILWNWAHLVLPSEKVIRTGVAAYNTPRSQCIIGPGCFLSSHFAPCTSRWMFIIICPPLPSGSGLVTFIFGAVGVRNCLLIKYSSSLHFVHVCV